MPDAVTTMSGTVFQGCNFLSNVTIGKNLKTISNETFKNLERLTTIIIPEDAALTTIGKQAFVNSGIRTITLPKSLTIIDDDAFAGCNSLTQIKIPDSVTSIGVGAFQYCSALARVTMGAGVTSIGVVPLVIVVP